MLRTKIVSMIIGVVAFVMLGALAAAPAHAGTVSNGLLSISIANQSAPGTFACKQPVYTYSVAEAAAASGAGWSLTVTVTQRPGTLTNGDFESGTTAVSGSHGTIQICGETATAVGLYDLTGTLSYFDTNNNSQTSTVITAFSECNGTCPAPPPPPGTRPSVTNFYSPTSARIGSIMGVDGSVTYLSRNSAGQLISRPIGGGRVEVECHYVGGAWRNVGIVTTNSLGIYVLHTLVTRSEYCRAVYLGSTVFAESVSPTKYTRAY
jgi:hypothetical protein